MTTQRDTMTWNPKVRIIKYNADQTAALTELLGHAPDGPELRELEALGRITPDEITPWMHGNLLVTVGLTRIAKLIAGEAVDPFNAAKGIIAVGDSATAAVVGDTDLVAATNKYYEDLDAAPNTATAGVISAAATFGSGIAEFVWNEWAIGVAANADVTPANTKTGAGGAASIILNRKVQSLGTKGAGSTWTLQMSVTLSNPA